MINIKTETAKLLWENFQIEKSITQELFDSGILHETVVKKVLIRDEYFKKAMPKEKQRLKNKLADKYCVSVELIEKIVRKN